ncbi:MAG: tetrapyrrole methylase family protein [Symbiobacteriaceae bacterium]|jgi:16S rRNA (cytidine1402-2'-O)-methyltransferase|nr:tetrapyrrole methylase family protein [Symbiobacteriaceae bacterium]
MGTLYIVGTPIGNLEDITHRALRILREVAVIAAEDTRQTRKLLNHFEIPTPAVSYHEHNQRTAGPHLIERLQAGDDVALVTDAGMPAISDPGEDLVRLAVAAGVPVVPIPGPTAFTTALVVSGLSTERFAFEGFLPVKGKERRAALERLKQELRTWILYEAPHRVIETLEDLRDALGDRPMAAARELTKLHEEVVRGTPAELLAHFEQKAPRGEFVLVISGAPAAEQAPPEEATPTSLAAAVAALEAGGMDRKAAMKEVATRFGLTKRDVYQALLELKEDE